MSNYLTLAEVAQRLKVSQMTVRRKMKATPDDVDLPWVRVGTGKRCTYRFLESKLNEWWFAVNPAR